MDNCYRIAGLTVQIEDSFGRTLSQAAPYKTENCARVDMVVRSNWEAMKDNPRCHLLNDDDGEYVFSGSSFYRQLLDFNGIMLHSSAVVLDEKVYLFTADSGTGKSTHTGLWLEKFGDRAFILNDDKPALRLEDGVWYAYGTPWSGKHDISVNTRIKLGGIAVIHRNDTNEMEPYSGREAIADIYKQVNRPAGMQYRIKILELLDRLFMMVPIWKFKCNNFAPDAVEVAYAAMVQGRKDSI